MRRARRTAGLVAAALAAALLASCTNARRDTPGVETLVLWETYNSEEHAVFDRLAREFEASVASRTGRNVKLDVERVPYEGLLPKLKYAAITHTAPDVCRVDNAWVLTLAYGKAAVPLDTLPEFGASLDDDGAKYVPAAYATNVVEVPGEKGGPWERHLFGIPDQTNCVALFWNRALFAASADALAREGLDPKRAPKDWDEFVRYARVLTVPEKKQYGFGMFATLWWVMPFLNTFGAEFSSPGPDGKLACRLDAPAALAAFRFLVALTREYKVEAGAWQTGAINPEQGFLNGKYAMILTGPWNLKRFEGVDFGVSLVPAGPAGTSSNVGGSNMVVFRSSKHQPLALEFLRWFTSPEIQTRWSRELGQIPVSREAFEAAAKEATGTNLGVFFEQLRTARPLRQVPRMDQIEDRVVNPAIELALKGEGAPDDIMRNAAGQIDRDFLSIINDR